MWDGATEWGTCAFLLEGAVQPLVATRFCPSSPWSLVCRADLTGRVTPQAEHAAAGFPPTITIISLIVCL